MRGANLLKRSASRAWRKHDFFRSCIELLENSREPGDSLADRLTATLEVAFSCARRRSTVAYFCAIASNTSGYRPPEMFSE